MSTTPLPPQIKTIVIPRLYHTPEIEKALESAGLLLFDKLPKAPRSNRGNAVDMGGHDSSNNPLSKQKCMHEPFHTLDNTICNTIPFIQYFAQSSRNAY